MSATYRVCPETDPVSSALSKPHVGGVVVSYGVTTLHIRDIASLGTCFRFKPDDYLRTQQFLCLRSCLRHVALGPPHHKRTIASALLFETFL